MTATVLRPARFPWFDYTRYSFSLGLAAGGRSYLSGHTASTFDAERRKMVVPGGMEEQTRIAYAKVEAILEKLIAEGRADAFFTCGSNRLLMLMKRLGKAHGVPGQVAMEQIMACGLGACYICVRTFEVNGEKILRRVCREGPVFDIQEAIGW